MNDAVNNAATDMLAWHPSIDTLDSVSTDVGLAETVDVRDRELVIDQLLWNALEPNPLYAHPQAATMLRAIASELASSLDRVAYLHPDDIAFHARAATARICNAGLAAHAIGDAVTGTQVMDFLGITHRELAELIIDDELVFVHDVWETTRLFPIWQFDLANAAVRPAAAVVLQGFAGTRFHRQRLALLSWMNRVTPGALPGNLSPVEWIDAGYDIDVLAEHVHDTAASLSTDS